jgi:imidazolonepropionase-like amidohydrolase
MSRRALHLILLVGLVSPPNAQKAAIGIPSAAAPAGGAAAAADETASFVVWETGGQLSRPSGYAIGEMVADRAGDTIVVRYRYDRRSQEGGQRSETRYRISATGQVLSAESRPLNPDSAATEPTERFEIADGEAKWTRNSSGRAKADGRSFYRLRQDTPFDDALLAKFLLGQPQQTGRLLPDGTTVRVEIVADTVVDTGAGKERVRLAVIHGVSPSTEDPRAVKDSAPRGVWIDDRGALIASAGPRFVAARKGVNPETVLPALYSIENKYRNAQGEALARRLMKPMTGALVIRNGDVFDSERGVLLPGTTVVIDGKRISAVGPAAAVPTPPNATVIDATGKTVMPGMWEMHGHLSNTTQSAGGLTMLATGLTTVRSLGANPEAAESLRDRVDADRIVSPRILLSGFMEGLGRFASRNTAIVGTEEEAVAWVERFHSAGYRQIKMYNLIHPRLVPIIAEEAHRRGMRVSGHVPRGLSVQAAVQLGFDEINHAPFLFSTFFQDLLYVPTWRPYSAVAAQVAPTFDVDGQQMTELIDLLHKSHTVIDGTFNLWMRGELTGQGTPASRNYKRLLKRLYDAGITLVAGTDNDQGVVYNTELELYEHAGIPAPKVLQIATIVAARVMGDDGQYGSIAAGKVADILIVGGQPAERVADLRKVEHVIRAGRDYDPKELREIAGYTGK